MTAETYVGTDGREHEDGEARAENEARRSSGLGRVLVDPTYAAGRRDGAAGARDAAIEAMRQVHARHDLGHALGAWPRACALCEASRAVAEGSATG